MKVISKDCCCIHCLKGILSPHCVWVTVGGKCGCCCVFCMCCSMCCFQIQYILLNINNIQHLYNPHLVVKLINTLFPVEIQSYSKPPFKSPRRYLKVKREYSCKRIPTRNVNAYEQLFKNCSISSFQWKK